MTRHFSTVTGFTGGGIFMLVYGGNWSYAREAAAQVAKGKEDIDAGDIPELKHPSEHSDDMVE